MVFQDPTGLAQPPPDDLRGRGRGHPHPRLPGRATRGGRRPWPAAACARRERFFLRYPHELSGGQRQRVVIAGAMVLAPGCCVADEPVSSLDASVRGEILPLLLRPASTTTDITVLAVTHDLGLAWNIADRIAVMYLGRIVEIGPAEPRSSRHPQHPYTQALLSVVPEAQQHGAGDPDRRAPGPEHASPPAAASTPAARCVHGPAEGSVWPGLPWLRGRASQPTIAPARLPRRSAAPSRCVLTPTDRRYSRSRGMTSCQRRRRRDWPSSVTSRSISTSYASTVLPSTARRAPATTGHVGPG